MAGSLFLSKGIMIMQSFYSDEIISVLILAVAFGVPGMLTIWNIYNCISKNPKWEKLISSLTVFVGGIFYFGLFTLEFEEAGEWYERIDEMKYHNSISSEYWLIGCIVFLGFVGYFVLLNVRADKLPPLLSALSISALILMNIIQIVFAIQISKNVDGADCLLYVYHANIMLLSARVIQRHMKEEAEVFKDRISSNEEHKKAGFLVSKINSISQYSIFIFIVFFFLIALIEVIFVLLGQGLDAPIKAFTDTADWTFSKQIPPPPLEHEGHYLCTVAAGGHKRVVKPIRLGTRRNSTIIVNRQLSVANAFEELVQERAPRFHNKIRGIYDTYGYPLSRKITTPLRADFVYIMMKPLEWIFLVVLYLFDLRPEQRIARQYMYKAPEEMGE